MTSAGPGEATLVAIDFGGTSIKIAVDDTVNSRSIPVTGTTEDLGAARAVVRQLRHGSSSTAVVIAIAVPGVLNRDRRSMRSAEGKYDYLRSVDLVDWARRAIGADEVITENDARAALWGATHGGVADGLTDAATVVLGTGVGTAVLQRGELLRGRDEHASILGGHITLDLAGPPCLCGNVGCAEAVASTWAFRRDATDWVNESGDEHWAELLNSPTFGLRELFQSSDPFAQRTQERYVQAWGALILTLCQLYELPAVVLAGGVAKTPGLAHLLCTHVERHRWPSLPAPRVITESYPQTAVLSGLLSMAGDQVRRRR